ncbi:MAG: UrcA family protein, partial [Gammaproteobacteria bacterium]|nr:UrcA family protein [Gammaproteobacteria bacterium]
MDTQTSLHRPRLSAALAGACITLAAFAPLAALADPPSAPAPRTLESKVSLADLDLTTPEGFRAAQERLTRKAEYLCHQLVDDNSASFRWRYAA